jgi:hypothetical protein
VTTGASSVAGDDHRGGVDAVLAPQALQPLGHVDDLAGVGVRVVHLPQLARHLVAVLVLRMRLHAGVQRRVPAHDQRGHGLGHPVAHAVGVAQHPGGVAHRGPGLDGGERHDLGHVVAAVALGRVADHLVPVARVEVHVDVGHGDARRVQEALEQQVVADRVEVGDAQAIGHRAARRAPPARADPDVGTTGVGDQVPNDQEVGAEAHVPDDLQLVGQPLDHLVGQRVAPALAGALEGQVAQVVAVGVEARRQRERRQLGLAEVDLDVGPLGDPQRVVARLGHLVEQRAHLGRGLQVVLVALELEAVGVAHERPGLHAQQGVLGHGVVAVDVVAVVGGQQRRPDALGHLHQLGVGLVLRGQPVVLQLHEQVVAAEDVLQAPGLGHRALHVPLEQRLEHVPAQAARGGDETLGVVGQRLPVDPGLVVVALEERPAGQLDQVAVAGAGLGQQRQVVVELLAPLGVAPGVVDAAPAGGTLVAGLVRHVGLGAEDRLHALLTALLVEVEDAVHVPVVGDADRGLAVGHGGPHDLADPGCPVEHRVLGVDVEVGEASSTRHPVLLPPSCVLRSSTACGQITPM